MKKIISIIIALVTVGIGSYFVYKTYYAQTSHFQNIAYSDVSKSTVLDIYIPKIKKEKYPVVIWIHGGAFKMGSKENPQSLDRFLEEGFAVVSINYRFSSEATWPAQLTDLKNVVLFVKQNSETYKFDTENIFSFGASAGGHLSAMTGLALASSPETKIKASVDWFGPIDFYTMDEDIIKTGVERKTGNNGDADSPESALIGATVKENKELSYKASPLYFLDSLATSTDVRFLIMHGAKDQMIGYPQSEKLRDALISKFGTSSVVYYLLPNGAHGGGDFANVDAENKVIDYLKQQIQK
ncbi:MAG: Carboxylesterase NlhH [Candidatus Parcubacteria bacterium]|jgi:acetyl esterase/lipase